MSYKLPKGRKPYIDSLGPDYINVDPRKLKGNNQILLDAAFTSAKQKFFQAGAGFPHLSWENVEIRVWPGQDSAKKFHIAFCFGVHAAGKIWDYVYMADLKSKAGINALEDWLRNIGHFETVH